MEKDNSFVNLIQWIDIPNKSEVLVIGESDMDEVVHYIIGQGSFCVRMQNSEVVNNSNSINNKYDFIFAFGLLEKIVDVENMIKLWKSALASDGQLFLGFENRLALRYFIGEKDKYSNSIMSCLEGYFGKTEQQLNYQGGRLYSKSEIERFIDMAGFKYHNFYSILPTLKMPQMIYSHDYYPKEDFTVRYLPLYDHPDTVFAHAERIYPSIIANNMFHEMAGAYLVQCSNEDKKIDLLQVTCSQERTKENAMMTIVKKEYVAKKPISDEGIGHINNLYNNELELKARGVPVIAGKLVNGSYVTAYQEGVLANVYLRELLFSDTELFIEELKRFIQIIEKTSDVKYIDSDLGPILNKGFVDCVPLNAFFINNEFYIFDQEYYYENYPLHAIISRAIAIIYMFDAAAEERLSSAYLFSLLGLKHDIDYWQRYSIDFLNNIKDEVTKEKISKYQISHEQIVRNERRISESESDYYDIVLNPFQNLLGRKLFVFGAGKYAKKYIEMYQFDYPIEGVLDNNTALWAGNFEGYPVMDPQILNNMDSNEYKVIICVKNYKPILNQLRNMGVKNIGTYSIDRNYPGRQALAIPYSNDEKKKYHIGYIAGVFDLYHLGHLNMFRRAKEMCDYLIVGVVSDAGVRHFKKTEPFVPFDERIELVRSCRYVDEAVEIPFFYRGTVEAFEKYHFDVQFSGSDYENDKGWLELKAYLNEHGSDMVFFPYTQQTSSTKLKKLINNGLI